MAEYFQGNVEKLKSYFSKTQIFNSWEHIEGYSGNLEVFLCTFLHNGYKIAFYMAFDNHFPNSRPSVYILGDTTMLGQVPHLLPSNEICYCDKEGLLLDDSNPVGIIEEAFTMSFDTLKGSVNGNADRDYLREFEYYWGDSVENFRVISLLGDLPTPRIVKLGSNKNIKLIGETEEVIDDFYKKTENLEEQLEFSEVLFIPLTNSYGISFQEKWDTKKLYNVIFQNIRLHNRILEYLKSNPEIQVYVTIPNGEDNRVHFCVEFEKAKNGKHPLIDKSNSTVLREIIVDRADVDYLLPRGGASREMRDKNVSIVGCGAIGSIVAMELAKMGVMNLSFIDHDKLSRANIYRHVLGNSSGIGKYKVEGLKEKIEADLPLTDITIYPKTFQETVNESPDLFASADLIIDATGIPNTSFQILDFTYNQRLNTPILHSWLEPIGIGGHVVTSNLNSIGCYRCLYSYSEDGQFYNKASFAAPGQTFSKSMFGCVNMFTPFSSVDATKTAILTVELAKKLLTGEETKSSLESWKGESGEFLKHGYKFSDRYSNLTLQELKDFKYEFANKTCSTCLIREA